jgi:hypothetical protein
MKLFCLGLKIIRDRRIGNALQNIKHKKAAR